MRVIMRTRAAMLIGALLCLLPLVSADEDSAENADNQERGWAGTLCSPPEMALDGNSVISSSTDYSKVVEVMFHGAIGPSGERRLCRIQCLHGEWVGPMCQINVAKATGGDIYGPLLRSCHFGALPPQLLVMYKNVSIVADTRVPFPDGTEVMVRCRELGVYKLLGESTLTCQGGVWNHQVPNCIPTTLLTNFTDDAPPTILVRVPAGSASVEPDGELAVFPGSIIHLECVFARKLGNPEWSWSSAFRQYLTGWAIAPEERDWKYRLSIYYSKPQDSGVFTCTTPHGLTNSVTINVVAVHCAPLEVDDPHVTARVEGSRLGHTAVFQCPMGFVLNGTANLTCHATGKWSGAPPQCNPVRCPRLRDVGDPHLELIEQNTTYLGRAYYRCRWGYRLTGPPGLECGSDGRWIGEVPRCQPVHCPPPKPPSNGRILEAGGRALSDGRYAVGSAVQFGCSESHQLVGEPTIVCTENGFWSHKAPLCKPRCPYPGDPENGRIAPLKFYYEPGDHVKVTCNPGFVIRERTATSRPSCRQDGSWSEEIPSCVDYTQV